MKKFLCLVTLFLVTILPVHAQAKRVPTRLPEGVRAFRDIAYVPGGGVSQTLDLFLPASTSARPVPLIVWIHGGAWHAGSKDSCPALPMLTKGFAVASINYRLSQQAIFPAQIHDCKAAIRWLRAHAKQYNLDAEHVGVWGSSAGGHLVALLGVTVDLKELEGDEGNLDQSSRVQAVCDWYGPTDLTTLISDHAANTNSPVTQLLGGPASQNKQKAAAANPLTYINKNAAPFLIMHGEQDKLVSIHQSEILHCALQQAGIETTLQRLPNAGHGSPDFYKPAMRELVEKFFIRHLKPTSSAR
jgi:acetyl esterase/lipase